MSWQFHAIPMAIWFLLENDAEPLYSEPGHGESPSTATNQCGELIKQWCLSHETSGVFFRAFHQPIRFDEAARVEYQRAQIQSTGCWTAGLETTIPFLEVCPHSITWDHLFRYCPYGWPTEQGNWGLVELWGNDDFLHARSELYGDYVGAKKCETIDNWSGSTFDAQSAIEMF